MNIVIVLSDDSVFISTAVYTIVTTSDSNMVITIITIDAPFVVIRNYNIISVAAAVNVVTTINCLRNVINIIITVDIII